MFNNRSRNVFPMDFHFIFNSYLIGCDTFQCFNGGTCVYGDSNGARCECLADFYGDNCEIVESKKLQK